jgi:hypothetical protein
LVAKHRNEEGGLGYHCYKNAAAGGDWILQRALKNGDKLSKYLPKDAPLSTFRVLTASKLGLKSPKEDTKESVKTLTVVWRAGRSGAATDHSAILYDVDQKTGEIKRGAHNQHWYKLGLPGVLSMQWTQDVQYSHHPDTKKRLKGHKISGIESIVSLAEDAHRKLVPGVPLVGWDVAVTKNCGILLLEGNFSCNFFMGTVDYEWYFDFCDEYFKALERGGM